MKHDDEAAHQTAQKFAQQAGYQYARYYSRLYSSSVAHGKLPFQRPNRQKARQQLVAELHTFLEERRQTEGMDGNESGEGPLRHIVGPQKVGKTEKEDDKEDAKAGKKRVTRIVMKQAKRKKDENPKEEEKPKKEEDEEWRPVTTPEGVTYYYNVTTRETRWDKPGSKKPEAVPNAGKGETSSVAGPAKTMQIGPWVEYRTPEGRFYYFNTVTTQTSWQTPDPFKERDAAHRLHCACAVCCRCSRPRAAGETAYHRLGQEFQKSAARKLCFQHKKLREPHELEFDGWTGRYNCLRNSRCEGASSSPNRSRSGSSRSRSPSQKRSRRNSPAQSRSPKKEVVSNGTALDKEDPPPPAAAALEAIAAATATSVPKPEQTAATPAIERSHSHPRSDRSNSRSASKAAKRSASPGADRQKKRSRSRNLSRSPSRKGNRRRSLSRSRGAARRSPAKRSPPRRSPPRRSRSASRSPGRGRGHDRRRTPSRGRGRTRGSSRDRRPPISSSFPSDLFRDARGGGSYSSRGRNRSLSPPRRRR
eukprot:GGOE01037724.1.p1 GENE.GGOE01037724.1~~GGOE01037724.1.p1  ORF type:complete len:587 (-),score=51.23 GGOE01037724.1:192-1790(-)